MAVLEPGTHLNSYAVYAIGWGDGGEGIFLAHLCVTETLYSQRLPFSGLGDRIIEHAPTAGRRHKGEGTALG